MTTSISNASAQALEADKAGTKPAAIQPGPPLLAELEQTWAGSLIFFVICLAFVLTTLAYGTVHYWALGLFEIGAVAIVIAWAVDAWRSGKLRFSRNSLQLPLAGLIAIGLIQLLPFGSASDPSGALSGSVSRAISLDPYSTRLVLVQLVSLLVYFAALLAYLDSPARLRAIVRTIIIFGFGLAFFAVIQSLISPTRIYGILEPRLAMPFGPFVNRHNFAGYMEMTLALPLGLMFTSAIEREKRLLYLTAIAMMGVAILMSGSRGGLVSFFAMVLFLVVLTGFRSKVEGMSTQGQFRARRIFQRVGLAMALLLVILAGVVLIGGESSLSRFLDSVNASDPTTGRTQIWKVTLQIIKTHPVIGAGLGAYGVAYTPFDSSNGMNRPEQAHNDYLQVLADTGIVGAILGIIFIVLLFRIGLQRTRSQDVFRRGVATGALAGCFAVLVHSIFDFTLHTTSNALLFLTFAGLATVNGRVERVIRRRRRRRLTRDLPPDAVLPAAERGVVVVDPDDEFEEVFEYDESTTQSDFARWWQEVKGDDRRRR
jgi:O-antigen ligase